MDMLVILNCAGPQFFGCFLWPDHNYNHTNYIPPPNSAMSMGDAHQIAGLLPATCCSAAQQKVHKGKQNPTKTHAIVHRFVRKCIPIVSQSI